ncbi:hypothetical protein AAMO2058_001414900 [Amorphochlora amoebiformis]
MRRSLIEMCCLHGSSSQKVVKGMGPLRNQKRWRPPNARKERKRSKASLEQKPMDVHDQESSEDELLSVRHAVEVIKGYENQLEPSAVVLVLKRLVDLPSGYEDQILHGNRTFYLNGCKNLGLKIRGTRVSAVRKYSQADVKGIRRGDEIVEIHGRPATPHVIRKIIAAAKLKKAKRFGLLIKVREKRGQEPQGPWLKYNRSDHVLSPTVMKIYKDECIMVGNLRGRVLSIMDLLTPEDAQDVQSYLSRLDVSHPCRMCVERGKSRVRNLEREGGNWQEAKGLQWGRCNRCQQISELLNLRKNPKTRSTQNSQTIAGTQHQIKPRGTSGENEAIPDPQESCSSEDGSVNLHSQNSNLDSEDLEDSSDSVVRAAEREIARDMRGNVEI